MFKNISVVGMKSWVALSIVLSGSAHAVEFSSEALKTEGPVAYWVTTVTCDNGANAGEIRRKTDGNEWCASGADGFCGDSKAATAEKICSADFLAAKQQEAEKARAEREQARAREREAEERKREQEAQQRAEQQRKEEMARAEAAREQAAEADRQQRIKIEESLLQIEQEKLSLRRQELELQRRAVEIREALDALDAG